MDFGQIAVIWVTGYFVTLFIICDLKAHGVFPDANIEAVILTGWAIWPLFWFYGGLFGLYLIMKTMCEDWSK